MAKTLTLETILRDTLWVAKMQGWREVGTYDEIGYLAEDEDCRDFDICANQPEHLKAFYENYFEYCEDHGWMTVQEFYKWLRE